MPDDNDNDNDAADLELEQLDFAGEQVHARALQLAGTKVAMGDRSVIPRHERISVLVRATITKLGAVDMGSIATLRHDAVADQAVIVDDQVADDVLDASVEESTGQMTLLSTGGELHAAARAAVVEALELEVAGWGDELPELELLLTQVSSAVDELAELDPDELSVELAGYYRGVIEGSAALAAHALAPAVWARTMLDRHLAAEQAELAEQRARHAKADEGGAVPLPGEVPDGVSWHGQGDDELDDAVRASQPLEGDDEAKA